MSTVYSVHKGKVIGFEKPIFLTKPQSTSPFPVIPVKKEKPWHKGVIQDRLTKKDVFDLEEWYEDDVKDAMRIFNEVSPETTDFINACIATACTMAHEIDVSEYSFRHLMRWDGYDNEFDLIYLDLPKKVQKAIVTLCKDAFLDQYFIIHYE